jgi:hypothetical protein
MSPNPNRVTFLQCCVYLGCHLLNIYMQLRDMWSLPGVNLSSMCLFTKYSGLPKFDPIFFWDLSVRSHMKSQVFDMSRTWLFDSSTFLETFFFLTCQLCWQVLSDTSEILDMSFWTCPNLLFFGHFAISLRDISFLQMTFANFFNFFWKNSHETFERFCQKFSSFVFKFFSNFFGTSHMKHLNVFIISFHLWWMFSHGKSFCNNGQENHIFISSRHLE